METTRPRAGRRLFGGVFNGLSTAEIDLQPMREELQRTHALDDWLLDGGNADIDTM